MNSRLIGFETIVRIYLLLMEIPRIHRETRSRVEFSGFIKRDNNSGFVYFKYPGGEIPYINFEDFLYRLKEKKFGDEEVVKIINLFLETVTAKATIASSKVSESVF